MKFQEQKNSLKRTEKVKGLWEEPIVKKVMDAVGLAIVAVYPHLAPVGVLVDTGVNKTLEASIGKKQGEILEELIKSKSLTEDDVEDLDFIASFSKLLMAANRTTGNGKIQYMTRLFERTICAEDKEYDFYEECLGKLERLSKREIIALILLKQAGLDFEESERVKQEQQEKNPINEIIEDREKYFEYPFRLKEMWSAFIDKASKDLGCERAEIIDIVSGLRGSGLCRQFPENTMPIGSEEVYHTTYYFERMYVQIL